MRHGQFILLDISLRPLIWLCHAIAGEEATFSPTEKRMIVVLRTFFWLCPILLVWTLYKIHSPDWIIPIALLGSFFAVIRFIVILSRPSKTLIKEVQASPRLEKQKFPATLLIWDILLIIWVLIVNGYYWIFGDWCGTSIFMICFGFLTCFFANEIYRKINFRHWPWFCGGFVGVVALLLVFQPYYDTTPFLWASFAFLFFTGTLLDKTGILLKSSTRNHKGKIDNRVSRRFFLVFGGIFTAVGLLIAIKGSGDAIRIHTLRNTSPEQIREIIMICNKPASQIKLNDPTQIAEFMRGIQFCYNYWPNREGICQPWQIQIIMDSGREVNLTVGNGNRSYPDAVYIQYHGAKYQSRTLYRTIQPLLWP